MKRVLITGGCGYIGSHIARAIKKDNDNNQVFVIDNHRREHTLKNLNGYLIDDFASKQSLMWIESLEPHVIIHCAGSSSVGDSITNPAEYYDNNISKTIKLLNFVKDFSTKPLIIFSSSASVYGNPTEIPVIESTTKAPISPYGFSKLVIEQALLDFYNAYELPSICFRYFNAAGAEPFSYDLGEVPGTGHIIAKILEASLTKKQFVLNGNDYETEDGTCVRDYIHVWDIALAHVLAINWTINNDIKTCSAFNLGTKNGISNKQILDYVSSHYSLTDVATSVRRAGDPDKLIASSDLVYETLNWIPQHSSLQEIVDSAYQWYTNWYKTNDI
jgi:UDP-glucose 4-epimerase